MKIKLLCILFFSFSVSACTERTVGDVLNRQGYLELIPPTNQHRPPSFNAVDKKNENYVTLTRVCETKEEELKKYRIEDSETSDQSESENLISQLSGYLDLSNSTRNLIENKIGLSVIKNIKVKFTNVKIISSSINQIVDYENKYYKTYDSAIKRALHIYGQPVCHTTSVLQADAEYIVEYKTNLKSGVEAKLNEDIASSLNAEFDKNKNKIISGKGLDFGVKLERRCLVADTPDAQPYYLEVKNLN